MQLSIDLDALPNGWLSIEEAAVLAELSLQKTVLEVGSYLGRSTVVLGSCARLVVAVDHHRGSPEHQRGERCWRRACEDDTTEGFVDTAPAFLRNLMLAGVADRVVPVIASFFDVAPILASRSFDLAFLDADHSEPATYAAACAAARLVRDDGAIVFHDYGDPNYPGVRAAVDRFAHELNGKDPAFLVGSLVGVPVRHLDRSCPAGTLKAT